MIRRFLYNFGYKYNNFMIGRYGSDEFNLFLIIVSVVLVFFARIFVSLFFNILAFALIIFCLFRIYSKNIAARYKENEKFKKFKYDLSSRLRVLADSWKNRKTHKYFRCTNCKTSIRVPRGVGKIEVSCPKCRKKMIKKV